MFANVISEIGALPGWNLSLLLLLTKATIILIVALGVTLSMQRASAGARHLVWLVTLGTLLLVPVLAAWAPLRLAILPAPAPETAPSLATAAEISAPAKPSRTVAAPKVGRGVQGVSDPDGAVPSSASTTHTSGVVARISAMGTVSIVLAIWALVVLGIMTSLAWAGMAVRRIVRHATPLTSADWVGPLFEIADRLGLEDVPRLVQSDAAKMPFACGVLTPTIVLPAEAEGWTLDRRRAVLLHELAHVRRHDLLGHTIGRLTCALYWFHPLVWTAAKKLRNESERACDDLALSCGTRATDYAEHLLDIVTSVRGDATPLVALAMARRKEFEGRMLAILDPELRHSSPTRRQSLVLSGMLALVSLTVAAAAPVQRVAQAPGVSSEPSTASTTSYPDSGAHDVSNDVVVHEAHGQTAVIVSRQFTQQTSKQLSQSASQSTSEATSQSTSHATSQSLLLRTSSVPVADPAPPAMARPAALPRPKPDPLATAMADVRTSGAVALAEIAKAGIHAGLNEAASALANLGHVSKDGNGEKGEKGAKGSKNPDDRPVLLAKVLRSDSSASLRRIAAWGLQEYPNSQVASEALGHALRNDADVSVREMAAWSIGNGDHGSSAAASALASALKSDASEKVRATSAWAIGNVGEQSSADALVAGLGDASADVRMRSAWALGNVSPRQAPRALVALLGDKDARTRELAAWALFQIEDPTAAPALEAALKTEQSKEVQIAYIRAIAAMGENSVDVLRGLLESPDQRVRAMAVKALAGGNAAGPWPWPWPMPRPFP